MGIVQIQWALSKDNGHCQKTMGIAKRQWVLSVTMGIVTMPYNRYDSSNCVCDNGHCDSNGHCDNNGHCQKTMGIVKRQ